MYVSNVYAKSFVQPLVECATLRQVNHFDVDLLGSRHSTCARVLRSFLLFPFSLLLASCPQLLVELFKLLMVNLDFEDCGGSIEAKLLDVDEHSTFSALQGFVEQPCQMFHSPLSVHAEFFVSASVSTSPILTRGRFTAAVGLYQIVDVACHPFAVYMDSDPSDIITLLHQSPQILVLLADGLKRPTADIVDMRRVVASQIVHVIQSLQVDV